MRIESTIGLGVAVLLGLAAACGDKGDDTGTLDPTFTNVYTQVLQPSCAFSSCHGTALGSGGLGFTSQDEAHAALVEVAANGAEGEILVVPGDADASYLIAKLDGAESIAGDPMPPSVSVDAEDLALVRVWIDAGANP